MDVETSFTANLHSLMDGQSVNVTKKVLATIFAQKFQVTIGHVSDQALEEKDEHGQPVTFYPVTIESNFRTWKFNTRYSELALFHSTIEQVFPMLLLPKFPAKTVFKSFTRAFVEQRARALEEYLNQVLCIPSVFDLLIKKESSFLESQLGELPRFNITDLSKENQASYIEFDMFCVDVSLSMTAKKGASTKLETCLDSLWNLMGTIKMASEVRGGFSMASLVVFSQEPLLAVPPHYFDVNLLDKMRSFSSESIKPSKGTAIYTTWNMCNNIGYQVAQLFPTQAVCIRIFMFTDGIDDSVKKYKRPIKNSKDDIFVNIIVYGDKVKEVEKLVRGEINDEEGDIEVYNGNAANLDSTLSQAHTLQSKRALQVAARWHKELQEQKKLFFGVPVDVLMVHSLKIDPSHKIPYFLKKAATLIEQKGLETPGIFTSSARDQTATARKLIDAGTPDIDFNNDPLLAADAIKLFLNELPEPLIPFALYEPFTSKAFNIKTKDTAALGDMQKLVDQIPALNRDILKELMILFNKILKAFPDVRSSLVETISPGILRSKTPDNQNSNLQGVVINYLIDSLLVWKSFGGRLVIMS